MNSQANLTAIPKLPNSSRANPQAAHPQISHLQTYSPPEVYPQTTHSPHTVHPQTRHPLPHPATVLLMAHAQEFTSIHFVHTFTRHYLLLLYPGKLEHRLKRRAPQRPH